MGLSVIIILSFVLFVSTVANAAYVWTTTGSPSSGSNPVTCLALDETHNILYAGADTAQGVGQVQGFKDEIPANSRRSYNMADKVPSGRASIFVESQDGARPIMVERAMYMNSRGAGTDTIGGYSD
jgi:hypothetical protein